MQIYNFYDINNISTKKENLCLEER